jgi:hypothetical protein
MDLLSQFPKNLKLQAHIRNRLDMMKKRQLQILTANFNKQPDKKDAPKKDDSLSPTRKNAESGTGKGKKAKKPQVNPLAMLAQSGLSPAE